MSAGNIQENIWSKHNAITARSLLGKFLNMFKAKLSISNAAGAFGVNNHELSVFGM
jgi:hypothetical protein